MSVFKLNDFILLHMKVDKVETPPFSTQTLTKKGLKSILIDLNVGTIFVLAVSVILNQ